jgi:spermidine synthase
MLGTKILEERKSKFNGNLRVIRSFGLGTYIQADGLTQSGGIVEGIWRSTLRYIHTKYDIQNVSILGLGGGTAAKLVRKFWPEAKITGVDIDPVMVELGRKYLELDKFGADVIIEDAAQYIKYNMRNTKYDLIVVDLYNGDQFPKKFESEDYIHLVRHGLTSKGVAIFNRLYFKDKKKDAEDFGGKLKKVFKKIDHFYPVTNIMFVCNK